MSNSAQRIVTSHKEAAKRATEYLARARNLKLKQGEALELVAHVFGVANWQTLHAMAKQGKAPRLEVDSGAPAEVAPGAGWKAAPANVAARLERYYTDQGFREHPIFGREDWADSVDEEVMDDASYWSWVARRLEHVKAMLPWDRDDVYSVQVCRAAGIDVDFDPNPELWVVASSELDEFLDIEGESSELALWTKLAAMIEGRVKALPHVVGAVWDSVGPAERVFIVKNAFAVSPVARSAQVFIPRESAKTTDITREALIANGFQPTVFSGSEFLVKRMKAWDMPYVREHIILVGRSNPNFRTEGVCDDSVAEIMVTPTWKVQLSIGEEYKEDLVPVDSDEGRGVLRDAGVLC